MFKPLSEIHPAAECWMDKDLIRSGEWSNLSHPAQSVYLPLMVHKYKNAPIFPSLERLAKLSGRGINTAGHGIRELADRGHISRTMHHTRHGNAGYIYTLPDTGKEQDGTRFPVKRSVVMSGTWSRLPMIAQALYVVMLCEGVYTASVHIEHDGDGSPQSIEDDFPARKWEHCYTEHSQLARLAGVDRSRMIRNAMPALVREGLAQPIQEFQGWRVFLHPQEGCGIPVSGPVAFQ